MTRTAVLSACIVAGIAGAAQAASVEFRIVERRNQIAWNSAGAQTAPLNDNVLNFSVQARVVGGQLGEALGNFGFDIVSNDATGSGTLFKGSISNADGSYNTAASQYNNNATVGRGGLSAIYSYLAGINPNFNGLINTDGGSFVQNPGVEDLGLVTGSPTGGSLLLLADTQGSGNPDTYSGSGTTAALDQSIADQFLGADLNWVPVYNFNYVVSNGAARLLTFSLANIQAQTFSSLALANGVWGPNAPVNATAVLGTGASVAITPAPGAAALLGLGGLVAARRRRN